jgi:hypothetical protein
VYCTANQEKLAYTKVQYLLVKTSIPYRILLLKRLDALETAIDCMFSANYNTGMFDLVIFEI